MEEIPQKLQDQIGKFIDDRLSTAQPQVYQNAIIAGQVKPRHLVVGSNPAGTLYTSDGTNFAQITPGTTGQALIYGADGVPLATTLPTPSYTWSSWVPTWGGFSVAPGIQTAHYIRIGAIVHFYIVCSSNGTSNANTLTLTLPITIASTNAGGIVGYGVDSGSILTTALGAVYVGGTTTLQIAPTLAQNYTGWTGGGTAKSANVQGFYEVA